MDKQKFYVFLLIFFVAFNVGCSSKKPISSPQALHSQKVMRTAAHWSDLANRVADQVSIDVSNNAPAIYVAELAPDMAFSRAFVPYLKQSLKNNGFSIAAKPDNAKVLNFRVQRFLLDPISKTSYNVNGSATLAAALISLGVEIDSKSEARAGLLGLGLLADWMNQINDTTDAEVMLIATVDHGSSTESTYIEEFYVQPRDLVKYWTDYPAGSVMNGSSQTLSNTRKFNITN